MTGRAGRSPEGQSGDKRTKPEGSRDPDDGERARWAAGRKGQIPRKIVHTLVLEVRTQG